jgi:rubredoxin
MEAFMTQEREKCPRCGSEKVVVEDIKTESTDPNPYNPGSGVYKYSYTWWLCLDCGWSKKDIPF